MAPARKPSVLWLVLAPPRRDDNFPDAMHLPTVEGRTVDLRNDLARVLCGV